MWTDQAEAHIARHGVLPHEVHEATERPYVCLDSRNDAIRILGRTYTGRYLAVLLSDAADGRKYVVTARNMTQAERRIFHKKAK